MERIKYFKIFLNKESVILSPKRYNNILQEFVLDFFFVCVVIFYRKTIISTIETGRSGNLVIIAYN